MHTDYKIADVGLGYVGLPLDLHVAPKYETAGFDLKQRIIDNCRNHEDSTCEVLKEEFEKAVHFTTTTDPAEMSDADFIIVAVPPPIDNA